MSFALIANRAVDAMFRQFGCDAEYIGPDGGDAVACRVVRNRADRTVAGLLAAHAPGDIIKTRVSELKPARNGRFTIETDDGGEERIAVLSDPRTDGALRLVWECTVSVERVSPPPLLPSTYFWLGF